MGGSRQYLYFCTSFSVSICTFVLASVSVFIWMDRKDREECNVTSDEAITSARLVRKRTSSEISIDRLVHLLLNGPQYDLHMPVY